MSNSVRLSRRLIELIGCSRRETELYIEGGWVLVDGEIIVEAPQFKVTEQRVELSSQAVVAEPEPVALLLHIPAGRGRSKPCADSVGLKAISMRRFRIGGVPMSKLPPGQWRYLAAQEKL